MSRMADSGHLFRTSVPNLREAEGEMACASQMGCSQPRYHLPCCECGTRAKGDAFHVTQAWLMSGAIGGASGQSLMALSCC